MRWVLLIVILPFCSSCWYVVHKNFTLPLNGYVKNNSIKMNGYYKYYDPVENHFRVFIFYNNGVVYYANSGNMKREEIDDYICSRILAEQKRMAEIKDPGAFRINGNKIEMNIITHTYYNWHRVKELQGTILSDTTFMITSDYLPKIYPKRSDTLVFYFVPAPEKPDSTKSNWVLHRKWYRGK